MRELIGRAYHLAPAQILGPAWLDEIDVDMFDHVPPGTTPDQIPHLLQVILAQRFSLAMHRDMRVANVFLLEVAKGGAKLDETPAWNRRLGAGACEPHRSWITCQTMSMPELAWRLQNEWPGVSPVLDRTGLAGVYDFTLYDKNLFGLGVQKGSPIGFKVQSLQEQLKSLGLTIEQRKEPAEFLVVDHCEKKAIEN